MLYNGLEFKFQFQFQFEFLSLIFKLNSNCVPLNQIVQQRSCRSLLHSRRVLTQFHRRKRNLDHLDGFKQRSQSSEVYDA
jgi:hypothetical protein